MTMPAAGDAEVRIDLLGRGGLRILQDAAAPGFGLDAVLLADFAAVRAGERVLDLGTGTGVIPLLLAAKQPACHICGLELMPQMARLAARSVVLNQLAGRVQIRCGDIASAAAMFGRATQDVVVSNPPYYRDGAGRLNASPLFAAARSERFCPLPVLLDSTAALLRPQGRFYLVHRAARLAELVAALEQRSLHVERLRMVQPFAGKAANLLLMMAKKQGRGDTEVLPPLVVYCAPGRYGEEMEQIYGRDFISGCHTDR